MPGMLAHFEHDGRSVRVGMPDAWASTTALPNLTDPATGGCILTLINLEFLDTIILFKPNVWHIRINKIKDDLFTGCLGEAAARALISLENV
jgi:hypothetical protein